MILERALDDSLIKSFMMQPEIYDRASEDGASNDPEFAQGPSDLWLFAVDELKVVGIVHAHVENGSTIWIHPYILRSHKDKYTKLLTLFIEWFDAEFPEEIQKISAYIPSYATKAYKAALSAGFKDEGLNRMSFKKYNKLWDRHLMGLIRGEINV